VLVRQREEIQAMSLSELRVFMTIIYITLNNIDEARNIGRKILEARLVSIAEISVGKQRKEFLEWLDKEC
jgi:uncharacterized protein involved in tolerance to divalent cations